MNQNQFCRIAERLMTEPAAPYHEGGVAEVVKTICVEHELDLKSDPYGNLVISLQTNRTIRPMALAAHMDHPGFHIVESVGPGRWLAKFQGGVSDPYFVHGTPVRLMPAGTRAVIHGKLQSQKQVELKETGKRK